MATPNDIHEMIQSCMKILVVNSFKVMHTMPQSTKGSAIVRSLQ